MKKLHIPLLFFLCLSLCRANDGYTVETGSAVNFSKSRYVQMVSEDIRIWLDDEKSRVQVDFVFKNHGPRHTVTMGFPDQGDNINLPMMRSVRSSVDGVRAKLIFRDRTRRTDDDPDPEAVEGIWTKRVSFAEGETRHVQFSYTVKHGWNVSNQAFARYILKTGATWRGKIQESRITVDWSRVKKRFPPILSAYSESMDIETALDDDIWRFSKGRAVGIYRNFVPDFDLDMTMEPGFKNLLLNGEYITDMWPRPLFTGDPRDLRVPVQHVPLLFESRDDKNRRTDWGNPCTKTFGGSISFPDSKTMLLGGRRKVTLKRPIVVKQGARYWSKSGVQMVYLKDVVEGLGGSYRYDPNSTRLTINIPK